MTKGRDTTSGILWALAALLVAAASEAQLAPPPAGAEPAERASQQDVDNPALESLRRARDALVDAKDFEAALNPALAAVAFERPEQDLGYVADLTSLARIQAELRDIDAAEDHYLEAINLITKNEGQLSPTLIDIYRGLGRAYIRGARYPEAVTTLEQAQDISRRILGLFNVEQSGLLDDITTAYLGLGDTGEARRRQLDRLDNAVRRFGADDPRVIPYRYVLANYYERSRLPDSAREQYDEALKTIETIRGGDAPELLMPLRAIVRIDLLTAQGVNPERRDRLAALLEQNPNAEPVERGLTLLSLGDWATVTGEPVTARSYYEQAWSTLRMSAQFDIDNYFAEPVMLDFVAPLSPVDRGARSRPYAWNQVVLEFDVSAEGLPSGVRVVDGGVGQLQSRYTRRLRETHFRPRLIDGEPVATRNVRSTHYFRVYVEPDDKD